MGIPSDGSYGIPKDVMYGFPVTCKDGKYEIVQGLAIDDYSREMMNKTLAELEEERARRRQPAGLIQAQARRRPEGRLRHYPSRKRMSNPTPLARASAPPSPQNRRCR